MKLEFSRQIFDKYENAKFHENPSSGSQVVAADGRRDIARQTEGYDKAGSRLSQLCLRA